MRPPSLMPTTHTTIVAGKRLVEHNKEVCGLWRRIQLEELAKDGIITMPPPATCHQQGRRDRLMKINAPAA